MWNLVSGINVWTQDGETDMRLDRTARGAWEFVLLASCQENQIEDKINSMHIGEMRNAYKILTGKYEQTT
jgi:hypothetical protein